MAKTLAQGRKPGSGRKPGKGKTLREGRKPGSGRRRRNGDTQDKAVRNTGNAISSRDLEAVDALRELNGNSSQDQQGQQMATSSSPTPTPVHILPDIRATGLLAGAAVAEQHVGQARSPLGQNRMLANSSSGGPGTFTLQDMSPYSISPQFMHSPPQVPSPLMVPMGTSGSSGGSPADNTSNTFPDAGTASSDDPSGSVLIHTSI